MAVNSPFLFFFIAFLVREVTASVACGPPTFFHETPPCTVFARQFGYELRSYPGGQNYIQMLMPNSSYEKASTIGFLRLAAYLNGDNILGLQMPLMLPFLVHPSPQINGYIVTVYTSRRVGTPPPANDNNIRIRRSLDRYQAVIGPFNGPVMNETTYLSYTRELLALLQRDRLDYQASSVTYARYSVPVEVFKQDLDVHEVMMNLILM